jgi:ABC-type multidrug transport system fused ATPase/permease subunit
VFSWWSKKAATNLHNSLFKRVLGAPILFFLRTPLGDVLNSFAKDQDTIDEALPDTLHMTTIYLMILLTSLAIVTVSIYYYAIMTAALFLAFFMMQTLYLPAATTLKRWAGDSAAAVFVHVDESLHGMDVIRAFDAVGYFIQENVQRINVHHLALFNTEQTHLWLAFWCDFFGAILVVATCLFSVAFKETLGSANVGLAISNTIQVRDAAAPCCKHAVQVLHMIWLVREAPAACPCLVREVPSPLQQHGARALLASQHCCMRSAWSGTLHLVKAPCIATWPQHIAAPEQHHKMACMGG